MSLFGNDEGNTIGKQMCHAATGQPCEGGVFTADPSVFFEIASAQSPRAGDSLVVSMGDAFSIGSDEHQCLIVLNNDPNRVIFRGMIEEGTMRSFDIKNEEFADTANLWCEKNVLAKMQVFKTADAQKIVEKNDQSVFESAVDGVNAITDEAAKKAAEERKKLERMLIGAAVFVVIVVIIAAITLPKLKIPAVNVA